MLSPKAFICVCLHVGVFVTHHPLQTAGIKCRTFGCHGHSECTPSQTHCNRRMASGWSG